MQSKNKKRTKNGKKTYLFGYKVHGVIKARFFEMESKKMIDLFLANWKKTHSWSQ
jgi:hypothetical protein